MTASFFSKAVRAVFFGNYFYGICAVALSIEASMQLGLPLSSFWFHTLLFSVAVLYYSMAYLSTEPAAAAISERSAWYVHNRKAIRISQLVLFAIFLLSGFIILARSYRSLISLYNYEWLLMIVFPVASVLYYGLKINGKDYNIRNLGLPKPFVIGFTWAGLVNVYPALFTAMEQQRHLIVDLPSAFLFIKNMMFISVLCIMFDIKDYEMDYNYRLKTLVVKLGPHKAIWYIILPLCILGVAAYAFYASYQSFDAGRIALNLIPFVAVILLAASLQQPRSILYYLAVIDGLMLLKAGCGIGGVLLFPQ